MSRKEDRKNKSLVYLLPMLLPNPESVINKLTNCNNSFINSYYHSETDIDFTDSYRNRIYIVFDKNKIKQDLIDSLAACSNYLRAEFNNDFLVFCFKIPDIYLNDFLLFKDGKYSKFSKEYKDLVIKCWPYKLNLRDILYPKKDSLEQLQIILNTREKITETQSKPDQIKETFKLSNYFKIDKNGK